MLKETCNGCANSDRDVGGRTFQRSLLWLLLSLLCLHSARWLSIISTLNRQHLFWNFATPLWEGLLFCECTVDQLCGFELRLHSAFLCLLVLKQFLCILLHCGLMPPVTSRSKHQKNFCYVTPQSDSCSIHMHGLFIDSYSIKSITCKSPLGFYTFVTSITECNTIGSCSGMMLLCWCLISRQPLFDESSRFANFLFV